MPNPFEDDNSQYYVLVNTEKQRSLWPAYLNVPDGWDVDYGAADRAACLAYIEENWKDMRPKSLIASR